MSDAESDERTIGQLLWDIFWSLSRILTALYLAYIFFHFVDKYW